MNLKVNQIIIERGDMMININCTLNCFFENDGKCTLTHVSSISSTPHPACLHFEPKNINKNEFSAVNENTEF